MHTENFESFEEEFNGSLETGNDVNAVFPLRRVLVYIWAALLAANTTGEQKYWKNPWSIVLKSTGRVHLILTNILSIPLFVSSIPALHKKSISWPV